MFVVHHRTPNKGWFIPGRAHQPRDKTTSLWSLREYSLPDRSDKVVKAPPIYPLCKACLLIYADTRSVEEQRVLESRKGPPQKRIQRTQRMSNVIAVR